MNYGIDYPQPVERNTPQTPHEWNSARLTPAPPELLGFYCSAEHECGKFRKATEREAFLFMIGYNAGQQQR